MTTVPITTLARDGQVDLLGADVVLDPTNGHEVPAGGSMADLVLYVDNTTASPTDVTLKAGVNPPATAAGQGDEVIAVPASSKALIGPIESARFAQANGDLNLDIENGATGSIAAFRMP